MQGVARIRADRRILGQDGLVPVRQVAGMGLVQVIVAHRQLG